MKAAFDALLRGDRAERDRLCARAEKLLAAETHGAKVQKALTIDFYVNRRGTAYSSRAMARAAGDLQ